MMVSDKDKNRLNFTNGNLTKLPFPETGRVTYKDKKESGLVLLVSYGGSKVFYLYKKINGRPYRIKIGAFPDMVVARARDKAIALRNQIADGINPAEEKAKLSGEMTFRQLFDKYINDYAKHNTKSWKQDIEEMDRKAKHFYPKRISTITKDDINKLFNHLTINTGKGGANRFLDRLRAIFNKAIEWGWSGANPTAGIKKHKQKSRDRYLTSEELPRFFKALAETENETIRDYVWLSLLTGARKGNMLAMRWDNISFIDKTWYIPETKNGEPHLAPLPEEALRILKARSEANNKTEWVFPSQNSASGHVEDPKKVWQSILQKAEIKDLRIHDLRRTLGSWMAHTGANQFVIGKSLNHKSTKSTAIYARLSIDPVRDAVDTATAAMFKMGEVDE